jgi:hypothetical protein
MKIISKYKDFYDFNYCYGKPDRLKKWYINKNAKEY